MKLSMWIIADALAAYNPEVKIEDGLCLLQGARICSDGINITKSAVYISENAQGQVVLANGHDMIYIRSEDPLDILNLVLDLFEKCNEWEIKVSEEISKGSDIQRLLELSYELLPYYLIIADASFLMRAAFGNSAAFSNEENFRISSATNKLPLDALIAINKQSNIRRQGIGAYNVFIPNSGINTAARNLFAHSKHIGWLVVLKETGEFTRGEMQLIDIVGDYAERCQENSIIDENDFSKSSFLLDLAEGRDYDPVSVSEQLSAFSWYEMDKKQVYVFQNSKISNERFVIDSQLSVFGRNSFQMLHHDTFVLIVNHSLIDVELLERTISDYLSHNEGTVGKSAVFNNIFMLKNHIDTARIAAQFSGKPGQIVDFSQVILPYVCSIIRDYSLSDISHPALSLLKEYDLKHDTELYKTLYTFLDNERNYTTVSKILNIHRSTLLYRLERIEELADIHLEDSDERFHLLLSFRYSNLENL